MKILEEGKTIIVDGECTLSSALRAVAAHYVREHKVNSRLATIAKDDRNFREQATREIAAETALSRFRSFVEVARQLPSSKQGARETLGCVRRVTIKE